MSSEDGILRVTSSDAIEDEFAEGERKEGGDGAEEGSEEGAEEFSRQ